MNYVKTLTIALTFAAPVLASAAPPEPAGAKNIVIVPDAFVDGSGWRVVYDILYHKGYNVTVVHAPHSSLEDDVTATRKILFNQVGTVIVVGHGVGGSVISNAGTGGKVKALVYVAGLQPEVGENAAQLQASMPAPGYSVKTDWTGLKFFDKAKFHDDYAGDVKDNRTNFMAASQVPITHAYLYTPSTFAVWHEKRTYGVVATEDRVLSPELQRWMYQRAGSNVTEIKASHAVYISQPEEVAKVIELAALNAK
ncbi:alpha/beta hydrolase [Oxalobacteraceae bacterium OM1]|nr:alpha/beta hydrolase [Oxalobacteraceae bacterium OM1]